MTVAERIAPKTATEVSDCIARCDAGGRKLLVVGGDTLAGMGFPPERADVRLEMTGLAGIVAHEPTDLTIAVQAGIPIQAVGNALGMHRQFVPFDAPRPQYATVGGTLAAGWLGPRRHLYGRPRDYVIGSTVALANGTIARAGGMVVKNVAGYDLSRLYVGSFGTLGVFVQINFKTIALPGRSRVFLARLPEGSRARALVQLAGLDVRPSAAFWIDGFHQAIDGDDGDEGRIVVLLEGSEALLERATRELRSALGRAGVPETRIVDAGARESFQRTIDAYTATLGERSITYRLHQFPEKAEAVVRALRECARGFELRCESIVDVMNGDLVARISDLDAHALGTKIEQFDEALHAELPDARVIAGEHPQRPCLRVWGQDPPAIAKMRALKARFDPHRTLNPGRFVGGI
ncbi:MAG TPA: FAD-binding oxidoreductase [Candidatus Tumulicola sp.]